MAILQVANVATAMVQLWGELMLQTRGHMVCISRGVGNSKPRSLPSIDGQQAIVKSY